MTLPPRQSPPVRLVVDARNALGEGILWDPETGSLWWLDIGPQGRIHRLFVASRRHQSWGPFAFATAMALRRDGTLVVAALGGLGIFSPATGDLDLVMRIEDPANGNRPNDGAADPAGRFWLGTMQQNIGAAGEDLPLTRSSGTLWRVDLDHTLSAQVADVGVSNSPIWSPDGRRFYFADSAAQTIHAYDYDTATGDISNPRLISDETALGYPDGSAMDEDGFLWNARWDGGCIVRLAPDGRIDRIVNVPVLRPTCCVFGGPERRTLYITSARGGLSADELARYPWSGGVMALETDVRGLPRHRFAG